MANREGEVREVPFLQNDMKDQVPTTGRQLDQADAPGKADSECIELEQFEPQGNLTVNRDDAQLDQTSNKQR
jgi:hypothetical protein